MANTENEKYAAVAQIDNEKPTLSSDSHESNQWKHSKGETLTVSELNTNISHTEQNNDKVINPGTSLPENVSNIHTQFFKTKETSGKADDEMEFMKILSHVDSVRKEGAYVVNSTHEENTGTNVHVFSTTDTKTKKLERRSTKEKKKLTLQRNKRDYNLNGFSEEKIPYTHDHEITEEIKKYCQCKESLKKRQVTQSFDKKEMKSNLEKNIREILNKQGFVMIKIPRQYIDTFDLSDYVNFERVGTCKLGYTTSSGNKKTHPSHEYAEYEDNYQQNKRDNCPTGYKRLCKVERYNPISADSRLRTNPCVNILKKKKLVDCDFVPSDNTEMNKCIVFNEQPVPIDTICKKYNNEMSLTNGISNVNNTSIQHSNPLLRPEILSPIIIILTFMIIALVKGAFSLRNYLQRRRVQMNYEVISRNDGSNNEEER